MGDNELTAFASLIQWYARFYSGLRRVIAAVTSEEEAAAWIESYQKNPEEDA